MADCSSASWTGPTRRARPPSKSWSAATGRWSWRPAGAVLRDDHAADVAFQATFLVLARRASTVRDRDRLGPWLVRTSRRIALGIRRDAARRAARERGWANVDAVAAPTEADLIAVEAATSIRAEVERLPEADRRPIELTYWQGKSYEEAAMLLSRPVGTIRSRLARARARLKGRLTRQGWAPALAAIGGASSAREASTRPPEAWIRQTVHAATKLGGGISAAVEAGAVPGSVAALVVGELATMSMFPWKTAAVLILAGGALTTGVLVRDRQVPAAPPDDSDRATAAFDPPSRPTPPSRAASRLEAEADTKVGSSLKNGGVEEGEGDSPNTWSRGADVPGVTYLWSRDTARGGKASLALKKVAPRYFPIAQWFQQVPREGDAPRLKVSAWVKAERATKAILDAQFIDADGQGTHAWAAYIGSKRDGDPPADHDWRRYEGVVAIPPGTKAIRIAPQIYGPGSVWFDDLAAEYTDALATDPTAP